MTTPEKTLAKEETFVLDLPDAVLTTFDDDDGKIAKLLWMPIVMDRVDAEFRAGALEVANSVRKALGLDPVDELKPGKKGDGQHCVIANTILDGYDGVDTVGVGSDQIMVGLRRFPQTKYASGFIGKFDHGGYTDLEN